MILRTPIRPEHIIPTYYKISHVTVVTRGLHNTVLQRLQDPELSIESLTLVQRMPNVVFSDARQHKRRTSEGWKDVTEVRRSDLHA